MRWTLARPKFVPSKGNLRKVGPGKLVPFPLPKWNITNQPRVDAMTTTESAHCAACLPPSAVLPLAPLDAGAAAIVTPRSVGGGPDKAGRIVGEERGSRRNSDGSN